MVATPSPKPRSATVRLDEVNEAPIEWVWPGYLPRARLIIGDGDPGIGKSTATLNVAAGLTCGRLPDGTATAPGNVLVMTAEDNLDDTVKPRLRAAGADMQRV